MFLERPECAVRGLPETLAHVVADGIAQHARERVGFAQVSGLLADHDDELALVLDLLRVRGDDDGFVMRDQRVDGTVADVSLLGLREGIAGQLRVFSDVLDIVESRCIEGARQQRHFDLDLGQLVHCAGRFMGAEGRSADFADAVVGFENAIGAGRARC